MTPVQFGDANFHVCKCCGEVFGAEEQDTTNPHICLSCARLAEDIQDDMIIQSAVPRETEEAPATSHSAEANEENTPLDGRKDS